MKYYLPGIMLCLSGLAAACHATSPQPATPAQIQHETTAPDANPAGELKDANIESKDAGKDAPSIDIKSLPDDAVTPYTHGSTNCTTDDFLPLLSDSSGYSQKWEFFIYTRPYEIRIKFEISNFAFSKNEGKIKGYVRKYDGDKEVENYPISKTLKSGRWKASRDRLDLDFEDYGLYWKDGAFHIRGVFEKGTFEYDVPANFWKPGTGNVYFGNSEQNMFKYNVLTYHKPVSKGVFTIDGSPVEVSGQAYANHYATTIAVYDMFDEVADFRKRTDDLLVEFRYYVPSAKYNAPPFGFLFVGADGENVFESPDIERDSIEKWLDEDNYGYEIDSRQRIRARDGRNSASFLMKTAEPNPKDPYADLPAFQRNIASRFSKPIEYSIPIDWELDLDVDGYRAKIQLPGSYTITRLR